MVPPSSGGGHSINDILLTIGTGILGAAASACAIM